jgi:integrase/recombinase XerD
MMSRKSASLASLIELYFLQHLRHVRGVSEHTVRAYADGLRLYLLFLADETGRSIEALCPDDIRAETVLGFLDELESVRNNGVGTRNCRLAAIRAFVAHLLRHDVVRAEQYRRILAIPMKKARLRAISYLEPPEVRSLLEQPDRNTALGYRDYALLLFLYNTGARVSEALGVQAGDLHLNRPRQVRLHGKGGKERICPLWAETAAVLQKLLLRQASSDSPIFRNARGRPLSRDGVAYLLDKYSRRSMAATSRHRCLRVTPHVLRHSCAVALLQAGIDVSVIRDYLGHASVATTSRYITTNLEMKRSVLATFWKRAGLVRPSEQTWRPTPKLLAFLSSL